MRYWLSVDPLVEETMDAYGYCYNNPINLIDPTGMSAEWIPTINDNGSTSYIAEKGDTAQTFATQYNLDFKTATEIVGNITSEGMTVSGDKVDQVLNNKGLLKLNLKAATDQDIINQFSFAISHSKSQGATGFDITGYFQNIMSKTQGTHDLVGKLKIDGENVDVGLSIQFYTSKGCFFCREASKTELSFFSNHLSSSDQGKGTIFGKHKELDHFFVESGFISKEKGHVYSGRTRFSTLSSKGNKFEKHVFDNVRPKYETTKIKKKQIKG